MQAVSISAYGERHRIPRLLQVYGNACAALSDAMDHLVGLHDHKGALAYQLRGGVKGEQAEAIHRLICATWEEFYESPDDVTGFVGRFHVLGERNSWAQDGYPGDWDADVRAIFVADVATGGHRDD